MRQPMEDKIVTISRAKGSLTFSAAFQLVTTESEPAMKRGIKRSASNPQGLGRLIGRPLLMPAIVVEARRSCSGAS